MKESISNAMVFNLIITFVIVMIMLFIGSLSYSKAYKVQNKIIEEIEKDQDFTEDTMSRINSWLRDEGVGYHARELDGRNCANSVTSAGLTGNLVNAGDRVYDFCVYRFNTCAADSDSAKCGTYYRSISSMYFDFPVIGDFIRIPVTGETMTFHEINS